MSLKRCFWEIRGLLNQFICATVLRVGGEFWFLATLNVGVCYHGGLFRFGFRKANMADSI